MSYLDTLVQAGILEPTEMGDYYEIGERYYSVGPLQSDDCIEYWQFSADKYDRRRWAIHNVFKTMIAAVAYRDSLKDLE